MRASTSTESTLDPRSASTARPAVFATAWFILTIVLSLGALSLQAGTSIIDPDVLSIVMLAPALAAAVVWVSLRRWAPPATARVSRPRHLRALGLAGVWGVIFYAVLALLNGTVGQLPLSVGGVPIVAMLALQLLGALGEEIGYRGVLLRAMECKLPMWVAAVANGAIFGAIHSGYWSQGPAAVLSFIAGTVGLVVGMVAARSGTFWQRVSTTTTIHFCANIAMFVVAASDIALWTFALAAWAGTAAALAIRQSEKRSTSTPTRPEPERVTS